MKIVIDEDIPFVKGVFEPFAEVTYEKGGLISSAMVKDADALIIRTRTKCNKELLNGSSVKIIASATIGKDHVDIDYCNNSGIKFINAAGCNAAGVMQYVFTALYAVAQNKGIQLPLSGSKKKVLGVIGVGNVGSKVAELGEYLGFDVLRNDPIKEREQTLALNKDYYSLEYLLANSDIISIHVYLDDVTCGMVNNEFMEQIKPGAVFINTSRGEVVNEQALLLNKDKLSALILDVWDNEPHINETLLSVADIVTPHIAGYSYEGKLNGTQMVVQGIAKFFDIKQLINFTITPDTPNTNNLNLKELEQAEICRILNNIFPIFEQSKVLREHPSSFEKIRSNYKYRREFYVKSL